MGCRAKEIKIAALEQQRRTIYNYIDAAIKDPAKATNNITYKGILFPEVIGTLEEDGFSVITLNSEYFLSRNQGDVVNLIFVNSEIRLTEEEMKESIKAAEAAEAAKAAKTAEAAEAFREMMTRRPMDILPTDILK